MNTRSTRQHKSAFSRKTKSANGNEAEVFVLPPNLLEKLGIQLDDIKGPQDCHIQLNNIDQGAVKTKSNKKKKNQDFNIAHLNSPNISPIQKESSILETASLMKESVFLSPTFVPTVANVIAGEVEIANVFEQPEKTASNEELYIEPTLVDSFDIQQIMNSSNDNGVIEFAEKILQSNQKHEEEHILQKNVDNFQATHMPLECADIDVSKGNLENTVIKKNTNGVKTIVDPQLVEVHLSSFENKDLPERTYQVNGFTDPQMIQVELNSENSVTKKRNNKDKTDDQDLVQPELSSMERNGDDMNPQLIPLNLSYIEPNNIIKRTIEDEKVTDIHLFQDGLSLESNDVTKNKDGVLIDPHLIKVRLSPLENQDISKSTNDSKANKDLQLLQTELSSLERINTTNTNENEATRNPQLVQVKLSALENNDIIKKDHENEVVMDPRSIEVELAALETNDMKKAFSVIEATVNTEFDISSLEPNYNVINETEKVEGLQLCITEVNQLLEIAESEKAQLKDTIDDCEKITLEDLDIKDSLHETLLTCELETLESDFLDSKNCEISGNLLLNNMTKSSNFANDVEKSTENKIQIISQEIVKFKILSESSLNTNNLIPVTIDTIISRRTDNNTISNSIKNNETILYPYNLDNKSTRKRQDEYSKPTVNHRPSYGVLSDDNNKCNVKIPSLELLDIVNIKNSDNSYTTAQPGEIVYSNVDISKDDFNDDIQNESLKQPEGNILNNYNFANSKKNNHKPLLTDNNNTISHIEVFKSEVYISSNGNNNVGNNLTILSEGSKKKSESSATTNCTFHDNKSLETPTSSDVIMDGQSLENKTNIQVDDEIKRRKKYLPALRTAKRNKEKANQSINGPSKLKSCVQGVEKPGGDDLIECSFNKVGLKTYHRLKSTSKTVTRNKGSKAPDIVSNNEIDLVSNEYTAINCAAKELDFCLCKDFGHLTNYDEIDVYEHIHFWQTETVSCDPEIIFSIYYENALQINPELQNEIIDVEVNMQEETTPICWKGISAQRNENDTDIDTQITLPAVLESRQEQYAIADTKVQCTNASKNNELTAINNQNTQVLVIPSTSYSNIKAADGLSPQAIVSEITTAPLDNFSTISIPETKNEESNTTSDTDDIITVIEILTTDIEDCNPTIYAKSQDTDNTLTTMTTLGNNELKQADPSQDGDEANQPHQNLLSRDTAIKNQNVTIKTECVEGSQESNVGDENSKQNIAETTGDTSENIIEDSQCDFGSILPDQPAKADNMEAGNISKPEIDNSTEKIVEKNVAELVKCGVCTEIVEPNLWHEHIKEHNYLAWKDGEIALDLQNEILVKRHLGSISKEIGGLICKICGQKRKQGKKYLDHMSECKPTEDGSNNTTLDCNTTVEGSENDSSRRESTGRGRRGRPRKHASTMEDSSCNTTLDTSMDSSQIDNDRSQQKSTERRKPGRRRKLAPTIEDGSGDTALDTTVEGSKINSDISHKESTERRRPGRPRKHAATIEGGSSDTTLNTIVGCSQIDSDISHKESTKRKRPGRPRKNAPTNEVTSRSTTLDSNTTVAECSQIGSDSSRRESTGHKRRGRPKKHAPTIEETSGNTTLDCSTNVEAECSRIDSDSSRRESTDVVKMGRPRKRARIIEDDSRNTSLDCNTTVDCSQIDSDGSRRESTDRRRSGRPRKRARIIEDSSRNTSIDGNTAVECSRIDSDGSRRDSTDHVRPGRRRKRVRITSLSDEDEAVVNSEQRSTTPTPPKLVICGVCKMEVDESVWYTHIGMTHQYLAWKEGEKPLNVEDESEVWRHLLTISQAIGKLVCYKCNNGRKKPKLFLEHIKNCTETVEEINQGWQEIVTDRDDGDTKAQIVTSVMIKQEVESPTTSKPNEVICAVCKKSMNKSSWIEHIKMEHNYLAWMEGKRALDLDDEDAVREHLSAISKKQNGLACNKCVAVKKYPKLFLTHIRECTGKVVKKSVIKSLVFEDEEEFTKCAVCYKIIKSSNWIKHIQIAHNYLAWREGDKPIDLDKEEEVKEHLSLILRQVPHLVCAKCGFTRRLAMYYMAHMETCKGPQPGEVCEDMDSLLARNNGLFECAMCHENVLPKDWQDHAFDKHYNITWIVGDIPIDLKSPYGADLYLREYKKRHDKLVCKNCGESRASFQGFYVHIITCGKTEEEMEIYKEDCTVCGKQYLGVYRTMHMAIHKDAEIAKLRESSETFLQQDAENEDTIQVSGPRKAAVKANSVIENYAKTANKIDFVYKCDNCGYGTDLHGSFKSHTCDMDVETGSVDFNDFEESEDSFSEADENVSDEDEELEGRSVERKKDVPKTSWLPFKLAKWKPYYDQLLHSFNETHSTENRLFEEWLISSFNFVPEDQAMDYMPKVAKSSKVNINGTWKEFQKFKGERIGRVICMFVGGSIQRIAWVPGWPRGDNEEHNYLAVCAHLASDPPRHNYDHHPTHPGLIQIWDFGTFGKVPPNLALGIALDFGAVWSMSWCPSGARDIFDEESGNKERARLGLLAIACSNGSAYILSVPYPSSIVTSPDNLFVKLKPVAELRLCSMTDRKKHQASAVTWSKKKGHTDVMVAYSDGTVARFDLTNSSPLLKTTEDGVTIFYPYADERAANTCVTGVDSFPGRGATSDLVCVTSPTGAMMMNGEAHVARVTSRLPISDVAFTPAWPTVMVATEEGLSVDLFPGRGATSDLVCVTSPTGAMMMNGEAHVARVTSRLPISDVAFTPAWPTVMVATEEGLTLAIMMNGEAHVARVTSRLPISDVAFTPAWPTVMVATEEGLMHQTPNELDWHGCGRKLGALCAGAACARCGRVLVYTPPLLRASRHFPPCIELTRRAVVSINMVSLVPKTKKGKQVKDELSTKMEPFTYEEAIEKYAIEFKFVERQRNATSTRMPFPERYPLAEVSSIAFCTSQIHHEKVAVATHSGIIFTYRQP